MAERTALLRTLLASTMLFIVIACGAGTGDGTGGLSYTGAATEASLGTITDAVEAAETAYQGGSTGPSLSLVASLSTSRLPADAAVPARPTTLLFADTIKEAFGRVDVNTNAAAAGAKPVSSPVIIPGDCATSPGYLSYDIRVGLGLLFTGTMNFHSFCSNGVTLDGLASASGALDIIFGGFADMTVSFSSLTVSSGTDSYTSSGEIAYSYSGSISTVTINTVLKDNGTLKLFRTEGLTMTIDESAAPAYIDVDITGGRFYHQDLGYVTITIPSALRFNSGDSWPSTGSLSVAGAANRSALLTVISNTQYQVDADTDGDSAFDITQGPLLWAAL